MAGLEQQQRLRRRRMADGTVATLAAASSYGDAEVLLMEPGEVLM